MSGYQSLHIANIIHLDYFTHTIAAWNEWQTGVNWISISWGRCEDVVLTIVNVKKIHDFNENGN